MIQLQNLGKSYGERKVLDSISFNFPKKGAVCLYGVNGAGKSTLLNILSQLDECDDGQITYPKNCVIGYLPQEPNPNPKETILEEAMDGAAELLALQTELEAILTKLGEGEQSEAIYSRYEILMDLITQNNVYGIESEAKELLVGLGFSHHQFSMHPSTLSGGWRMRLELVRLFIKKPNFLILDEPTNHLDLPSLKWVEGFLNNFQGCLLFVTHDRALINSLSKGIMHLKDGKLKFYPTNFDGFLQAYELEQELAAAQLENITKKTQHMQKFVDTFGAKASKAKQAQSRLKMIAKLNQQAAGVQTDNQKPSIAFQLDQGKKSGRIVLKVKDLATGYGDKILVKNLSFQLERGQKIAIIGANGIGKSTLLKTVNNIIPSLGGEITWGHDVHISYFAQDQLSYLDPKKTVLENMMELNPHLNIGQARSALGSFLFSGDDVFKPVKVLSGGEKNRVGLCSLLVKKANTLLLDEPTNHLDMQSVEMLTNALLNFEGSMLLVSHNRSLIDDVATHVLGMNAQGKTLLVEGDLERFYAKAQQQKFEM